MFISDYLPSKKQLSHCVRNKFLSCLCAQIFLELCRDFKSFPVMNGKRKGIWPNMVPNFVLSLFYPSFPS